MLGQFEQHQCQKEKRTNTLEDSVGHKKFFRGDIYVKLPTETFLRIKAIYYTDINLFKHRIDVGEQLADIEKQLS